MAKSQNMSLQEWGRFCQEYGLDPVTGGKMKTVFIHYVDQELIAREQDEWMEKMRAHEKQWQEAHQPQPKPKWRLRWVKV